MCTYIFKSPIIFSTLWTTYISKILCSPVCSCSSNGFEDPENKSPSLDEKGTRIMTSHPHCPASLLLLVKRIWGSWEQVTVTGRERHSHNDITSALPCHLLAGQCGCDNIKRVPFSTSDGDLFPASSNPFYQQEQHCRRICLRPH